MSLTVTETGADFKRISEGVHLACCVWCYDLGTQYNAMFDNHSKKVLISFEVPEETITVDGVEMPMVISKRYTASLNKKSQLRKDLESWRGRAFTDEELKGFNLRNILGKSCQIQVIHTVRNDRTYANISAIMSLPKGTRPLQPKNSLIFYEIEDPNIPPGTPEWIEAQIHESLEWSGNNAPLPPAESASETDVEPF